MDLPTVVVQEQVVVSAEQDAVSNIGTAVISIPVGDVMGFAPGGRTLAVTETAAAISCGEGDALRAGEHPLLSTHVEWLKSIVKNDLCGATGTRKALNGVDTDSLGLAFNVAGTATGSKRGEGDEHTNDGCPSAQQLTAVGFGTLTQQLEENVGGELCGRAGIFVVLNLRMLI